MVFSSLYSSTRTTNPHGGHSSDTHNLHATSEDLRAFCETLFPGVGVQVELFEHPSGRSQRAQLRLQGARELFGDLQSWLSIRQEEYEQQAGPWLARLHVVTASSSQNPGLGTEPAPLRTILVEFEARDTGRPEGESAEILARSLQLFKRICLAARTKSLLLLARERSRALENHRTQPASDPASQDSPCTIAQSGKAVDVPPVLPAARLAIEDAEAYALIKQIVCENPFYSLWQIKKRVNQRLKNGTSIGLLRLYRLLRRAGLRSRHQRLRFYRSR